jgi:two-component system, response regulator PdtaR
MLEGKRVFIAEDDGLLRLDLKTMLTRLGCDVIGEAVDGSTAVLQIRRLQPDAVILDVRMPVMNGLTATAHLSGQVAAPVLLVSGLDYESTADLAREVGAAGLLPKPFNEQQLATALQRAITREGAPSGATA